MVVALDELGHLTCCYLGTDPSIFSSSSTASRELNYEVHVQACFLVYTLQEHPFVFSSLALCFL